MKKLIITGASGFVGGVTASIAAQRFDVTGTYFSTPFKISGVKPVKLDITDKEDVVSLISSVRPDAVIHCAAQANLDICETNHKQAEKVNINAVRNIVSAAKKYGSKVIFTSSDMVYGGEKSFYKESDLARPVNFYGITKKQAEEILFNETDNFAAVRVALVYGLPVTSASSFTKKVINDLKAGNKVFLFTDQFRTPVYVVDLANALIELAENNFSGIINIGGIERINRYSMGRILAEVYHLNKDLIVPCLMKNVFQKAQRPVDTSLDISLAKKVFNTNFNPVSAGIKKDFLNYSRYSPQNLRDNDIET